MSIFILYVWMAAATGAPKWVSNGEYAGKAACEAGYRQLGIAPNMAKCVDSGRAAGGAK